MTEIKEDDGDDDDGGGGDFTMVNATSDKQSFAFYLFLCVSKMHVCYPHIEAFSYR